jgi:hypothetical protein
MPELVPLALELALVLVLALVLMLVLVLVLVPVSPPRRTTIAGVAADGVSCAWFASLLVALDRALDTFFFFII